MAKGFRFSNFRETGGFISHSVAFHFDFTLTLCRSLSIKLVCCTIISSALTFVVEFGNVSCKFLVAFAEVSWTSFRHIEAVLARDLLLRSRTGKLHLVLHFSHIVVGGVKIHSKALKILFPG